MFDVKKELERFKEQYDGETPDMYFGFTTSDGKYHIYMEAVDSCNENEMCWFIEPNLLEDDGVATPLCFVKPSEYLNYGCSCLNERKLVECAKLALEDFVRFESEVK